MDYFYSSNILYFQTSKANASLEVNYKHCRVRRTFLHVFFPENVSYIKVFQGELQHKKEKITSRG